VFSWLMTGDDHGKGITGKTESACRPTIPQEAEPADRVGVGRRGIENAWRGLGETPPGKPPTRTRHPEVSSGTKTDFQASPAAKASGVHEKKPFAPRIPEREREHPAVASGQEAGGIHHNNFLILPRHAAKMTLETARHCAAVLTCNINEKQ
jgi:hypothetical protein